MTISAHQILTTVYCKTAGCAKEASQMRGRYAGLCTEHAQAASKNPRAAHSLDDEIERLVNLGESDPVEAARKLERQHSKEWLAQQLAAYAEDILAEMFRRRLGAVRRKAEVALRPGDVLAEGEFKIAKTWVPGIGWKAAGELSPSDLRAKAAWYEKAATAAMTRVVWCVDVAEMMEAEGVDRLADLSASLPALPERDLQELVS